MRWKRNKNDDENQEYRLEFMTDEEIAMVDDYLVKIEMNRGYMDEYYTRWEKEQEAYSGDQELIPNRPNSRVNIINANIEGQVASLVEKNLAVVCRGEGPSDEPFSRWAKVGLDWVLRKNRIKRLLERHERRRELFGPAWFKVHWDSDAVKGFGLATITCPPLNAVFVDTKVNDPLNLQDAEYIAEVMPKSKTWATERFGDIARNIHYGGSDRSLIFTKEHTTDDDDAFWYVQLWTKTEGKLRLIEFSDDGILLADSFKVWTGKKFKDKEKPKPFYRYNKLPYFLTNLYYEEGKLLGFGDGKLLRPLQDMLNDLYDQVRRAAKPNRIFFDPASEVELEDIDEDDGPVPANDPNQTIRVVEVGRVNPALWQLITNVHVEVQRVIRFAELMIGQSSKAKTATEAAIQQQQGGSSIDHKKLMLQETLVELCEYVLDLMIENYEGAKAFRIDENKDDYEWIDFRQMDKVPVLVPAESGFSDMFRKEHPDLEPPRWQQMENETKSVDLDIEINIGAGLPRNKAFLYQMLESLSRMVVDGRNVISWAEFREFAKDFLGLPLDEDSAALVPPPPLPQGQPVVPPGMLPGQGAETEGLSPQGAPMMGNLPPTGGVL